MSEEELIDDLKYRTDYGSFEDFDKVSKLIDLYNKEKEKNRIMKAEFERLENIEDDTAQLKLLLKEEKEKNAKLLDEAMVTYFDDEEIKKSIANYIEKLLKENIQKDYISKNKIKEFIKNETFEGTYSFDIISAKRLKKLLEE